MITTGWVKMPLLAALGSVAILLGFAALSVEVGDPHWMNRGGAALAAYSLLLALWTGLLESHRSKIERNAASSDATRPGYLNEMAQGDLEEISTEMAENLELVSRRYFWLHISFGLLGELLHGFGDLVMLGLFPHSFAH